MTETHGGLRPLSVVSVPPWWIFAVDCGLVLAGLEHQPHTPQGMEEGGLSGPVEFGA